MHASVPCGGFRGWREWGGGVRPEPSLLHRLEELQGFLLYKNKLTYLPQAMLNLKKLTLLVVSGDDLVELPTALCDASTPLK